MTAAILPFPCRGRKAPVDLPDDIIAAITDAEGCAVRAGDTINEALTEFEHGRPLPSGPDIVTREVIADFARGAMAVILANDLQPRDMQLYAACALWLEREAAR